MRRFGRTGLSICTCSTASPTPSNTLSHTTSPTLPHPLHGRPAHPSAKARLLACRRAGVTTMVHTIYQQRSRVIDADRPKFGNRQPPDQAAMPSGHLAVSVRVELPGLLACKCADAQETSVSAWWLLRSPDRISVVKLAAPSVSGGRRRRRRQSATGSLCQRVTLPRYGR